MLTLKRTGILPSPAASCHAAASGAPPASSFDPPSNDFPFYDPLGGSSSDDPGFDPFSLSLATLLIRLSLSEILCPFRKLFSTTLACLPSFSPSFSSL